jgi:hypothetical protein
MNWYDNITSLPVILAGVLGISAVVYAKRGHTAPQAMEQAKEVAQATKAEGTPGKVAQGVSDLGEMAMLILGRPLQSCRLHLVIWHLPRFASQRV